MARRFVLALAACVALLGVVTAEVCVCVALVFSLVWAVWAVWSPRPSSRLLILVSSFVHLGLLLGLCACAWFDSTTPSGLPSREPTLTSLL